MSESKRKGFESEEDCHSSRSNSFANQIHDNNNKKLKKKTEQESVVQPMKMMNKIQLKLSSSSSMIPPVCIYSPYT